MFDSIIFKNPIEPLRLIDPGMIAESLIFYRQVKIVGNTGTLKAMLKSIPPLVLLELLKEGWLEFYYLEDQTGVSSQQHHKKGHVHSLVSFSSPEHTIERVGPEVFRDAAKRTGVASVYAKKFTHLLKSLDHKTFNQLSVFSDLADSSVTACAVEKIISLTAPGYICSDQIFFRIEGGISSFSIETNLDFDSLNKFYHLRVPPEHSSITPAYLVSLLQNIQEELFYAATLQSEVATDTLSTELHSQRLNIAIQRRQQSAKAVSSFSGMVLNDTYAIRNAVNSGKVSFSDVLRLIEKGRKFRDWLRNQSPDADLLNAYYRKTVEKTWAERLPTKAVRWMLFSGAGLAADNLGANGIGTVASQAISAVDQFLIDRLLKSWKPHHYIEEQLLPTLNKSIKE